MPTAATLPELLRPFVGIKLNRLRDPASRYGGYLPLTATVDIHEGVSARRDVDLRAVGEHGVEVFSGRKCDFIPWDAIRLVRIAGLDADGRRVSSVEYDCTGLEQAA